MRDCGLGHGSIDGYSRLVFRLLCADNKRARTVFDAFREVVSRCGYPQRVRGDRGGENVLVAEDMFRRRGIGIGFIAGRSIHNQRIERLWREVWRLVTSRFARVFSEMEEHAGLDAADNLHRWALVFVFCPRIQQALDAFVEGHHHHVIAGQNATPWQLWLTGMLEYGTVDQPENVHISDDDIEVEAFPDEDLKGLEYCHPTVQSMRKVTPSFKKQSIL